MQLINGESVEKLKNIYKDTYKKKLCSYPLQIQNQTFLRLMEYKIYGQSRNPTKSNIIVHIRNGNAIVDSFS